MRIHHALLLVMLFLLAGSYSVSGTTKLARLRAPKYQKLNSVNNNQQLVRAGTKTHGTIDRADEERRALTDLRNKLVNKASVWFTNRNIAAAEKAKFKAFIAAEKLKNRKLRKLAKAQVSSDDLDAAAQNLLKEVVTPDHLHIWFGLDKKTNQWTSKNPSSPLYYVPTPQYQLWEKLKEATMRVS
ncbi:hypothetical protein GN244_ATG20552 [Phytophthora infestans]|uniref:Secreted RxLR effector peptide protein n=1 Tax=Phytophthora infestans TaxID=4787 RepID=A0A833RXH0_PHYIN|nr:hypothetical protein GN244_ATG20552 [Phytophthora infestans]